MLVRDKILTDISNHRYQIKVAKTPEEVDSALKLRFHVFNTELRRGFDFKDGLDRDRYDEQFHHLLVQEKASGKTIGTYRLQTSEQAMNGEGFYSETRFHLQQFPQEVLEKGVEIGRACIHQDYRNSRVLFLLWKGMAGYLQHFKKRYLFGSSAVSSKKPGVGWQVHKVLKENNFFHPEYRVDVKPPFFCEKDENTTNGSAKVEIPQLFQNYLDVGSKVCGGPALDTEANSIYFLTLLDLKDISDRTRRMFFG